MSRKCFNDVGHWSGAKRVANMLARLKTFGTTLMPVAFAVPTMTVFLFALLSACFVASVVVARFGFFATVDHTSPRDALDTDESTGGSATLRFALDTDESTGGNDTQMGALDTDESTGGSATLRGALDTDESTGGSPTLRGALDTDESTGGSATLRGALDTDESTDGSATLRGALDTDESTGGSAALRGALDTDESMGGSATLRGALDTDESTGGSATLRGTHDTDESTGGSAALRGALDTDESTGGSATLRGALDTDEPTGGSAALRGALDADESTGGSAALRGALDTDESTGVNALDTDTDEVSVDDIFLDRVIRVCGCPIRGNSDDLSRSVIRAFEIWQMSTRFCVVVLCDSTPACRIATLSDRLSSFFSNTDTSIALKVIGGRLARSDATKRGRVAASKGNALISMIMSLTLSSSFYHLFSVLAF